MKFIIAYFLLVLVGWLCAGFIGLSWDVFSWSEAGRSLLLVLPLAFLPLVELWQ